MKFWPYAEVCTKNRTDFILYSGLSTGYFFLVTFGKKKADSSIPTGSLSDWAAWPQGFLAPSSHSVLSSLSSCVRLKYANGLWFEHLTTHAHIVHLLVSILGLAHDPGLFHPSPVALYWTAALHSPPDGSELNPWLVPHEQKACINHYCSRTGHLISSLDMS